MFRFAHPSFLALLAVIPLAVFLRRRRETAASLAVSSLSGIGAVADGPVLWLSRLAPVLKYLALALLVLGLARPQWGVRRTDVMTEGINVILAVDLSESMSALDFQLDGHAVNRLEAVKSVVKNFVSHRSGDRIGMVVFGTHAYTQLPLTRDYDAILTMLDRLAIGAAGKTTAIGDAIGISLKRIEDVKSVSNVIILLTDGRSNAGELSPDAAADVAAQRRVKIHAIGVGGRGEAPFQVQTPLGPRIIRQRVDIDEDALRRVADKTGGNYFHAANTDELARIYDTIDQMEKTEVKIRHYDDYREWYPFLLVPAFALLCLWHLLTHTRLLRVP